MVLVKLFSNFYLTADSFADRGKRQTAGHKKSICYHKKSIYCHKKSIYCKTSQV